jgi:hypothetical protein
MDGRRMPEPEKEFVPLASEASQRKRAEGAQRQSTGAAGSRSGQDAGL